MDLELLRFNKTKTFCFVDFETENLCLNLSRNLPWQVGMMKTVGDIITQDYASYIKWYRLPNVSVGAAEKTRFRPEMVSGQGVDYMTVIREVVKWTMSTDYIIGHNILGFDIYFLVAFYKMVGQPFYGLAEKMIDTHALAKGIKTGNVFDSKTTSLLEYQYRMLNFYAKGVKTNMTALGQEYGIEHDYANLHDALVDLQLNVKIWNKLKYQTEI